jgi:hypothetical protein
MALFQPARVEGNGGAMRSSLRRPPTALEQLLGRRRAKALRRRLGFVALGAGLSLLKPRTRWTPLAMTGAVLVTVIVGLGVRPM